MSKIDKVGLQIKEYNETCRAYLQEFELADTIREDFRFPERPLFKSQDGWIAADKFIKDANQATLTTCIDMWNTQIQVMRVQTEVLRRIDSKHHIDCCDVILYARVDIMCPIHTMLIRASFAKSENGNNELAQNQSVENLMIAGQLGVNSSVTQYISDNTRRGTGSVPLIVRSDVRPTDDQWETINEIVKLKHQAEELEELEAKNAKDHDGVSNVTRHEKERIQSLYMGLYESMPSHIWLSVPYVQ